MRFVRPAPILFLILLGIGLAVHAQVIDTMGNMTGGTAAITGDQSVMPTGNIDGVAFIGKIVGAVIGNNYIARFVEAATIMSINVIGLAKALAGVIGLLTIIWEAMMNMKDDKPVANGLIETVIYTALILFLLQTYPTIVGDFTYLGLQVLTTATGAGDIGVIVTQFITGFIGKIFTMIAGVWHGFTLATLTSIPDAIFAALCSVAALIFAIMALVQIIEVALIGPVIFALGIVLGPLFIACLISSWTRSWFQSWINFMVNAACITAILGIVVTLVYKVAVQGNDLLTPGASNYLSSDALATALLAYIFGKIFSAVPGYADALLPGRTGAGGGKNSQVAEKFGKQIVAGIKSSAAVGKSVAAGAAAGAAKAIGFGR